MKAGIITIYDTSNYGNRLQNYALQQVLLRYADRVVTLQNKIQTGRALEDWKTSSPLSNSLLLNSLKGEKKKVRMLRFNKKHIRLSRKCYWYNAEGAAPKKRDECDIYCAGSDQVWNPELEREGPFNFAGFAEGDRAFSYAASFGISRIPEEHREQLRRGLNHLKYISVREESGRRIVEELTGRTDAEILIDPTMLLTAREWEAVTEKPEGEIPERYILTYFLGTVSQERRAEVARAAAELDCQVLELMDSDSAFRNVGAEGFLYLIRNARMICTDSFHGSVFSFLWQRPMAIFFREGDSDMSDRLLTLAKTFSLSDRLAYGGQIPQAAFSDDYSLGCAALQTEREKSAAFLTKVFGKIPSYV